MLDEWSDSPRRATTVPPCEQAATRERDERDAQAPHGDAPDLERDRVGERRRQVRDGDLGHAVGLPVLGDLRGPGVEGVGDAAGLARQRALGHLQAAVRGPSAGIARARDRLHDALLGVVDELVLVAVVPPVEHQLVEARHLVLDERREARAPVDRGDELVGVAEHGLHEREAHGREGQRAGRRSRDGAVDARDRVPEDGLDTLEHRERAVAVLGVAGRPGTPAAARGWRRCARRAASSVARRRRPSTRPNRATRAPCRR